MKDALQPYVPGTDWFSHLSCIMLGIRFLACREDADFLLLKLCLGVGLEDLLLSRFVLVCHDGVQPLLSLLYVVVCFWFWRGLLHFFKLQMGTSVERLD